MGCLALVLASLELTAEPLDQPYKVWVGSRNAKLFSGPGLDFYPTQQLTAGTECEVYKELKGGWLAIRPPAGSHSLVLRSALEFTGGGSVARVKREATPCRIGSVLSEARNTVQVRLEPGETVQVIDDGTAAGSPWATIAPPAGEFRYVQQQEVTRDAPIQAAATNNWHASEAEQSMSSRHSDEVVRVSNDEDITPITLTEENNGTSVTEVGVPHGSNFGKALDQLEIKLSRRITGPVNLWVFDDLEREAAQLMSQTAKPQEQQAVSQLASRMARFAAIGRRYRESPQPTTQPQDTLPTAGTTSIAAKDPALSKFDAVGVLRPVVSQRGTAPPFALVDESGQVVTFVTPSPSQNLTPLLGQRVGISGTRSFLPQFNSRNIQTARVAPVETTLRR